MLQKIGQFHSFKYLVLIKPFDVKMMTKAFIQDGTTEDIKSNENLCVSAPFILVLYLEQVPIYFYNTKIY